MLAASNASVLGLMVVARWKRRNLLLDDDDEDDDAGMELSWASEDVEDEAEEDNAVTVGIFGLFKSSSLVMLALVDIIEVGVGVSVGSG